jgi:hypothetical protein
MEFFSQSKSQQTATPLPLTLLQALRPLIRPIEEQDRKLQVAQDSATLPPVKLFDSRRPQDHFPAASGRLTLE